MSEKEPLHDVMEMKEWTRNEFWLGHLVVKFLLEHPERYHFLCVWDELPKSVREPLLRLCKEYIYEGKTP